MLVFLFFWPSGLVTRRGCSLFVLFFFTIHLSMFSKNQPKSYCSFLIFSHNRVQFLTFSVYTSYLHTTHTVSKVILSIILRRSLRRSLRRNWDHLFKGPPLSPPVKPTTLVWLYILSTFWTISPYGPPSRNNFDVNMIHPNSTQIINIALSLIRPR